jgi:hypothetical protein
LPELPPSSPESVDTLLDTRADRVSDLLLEDPDPVSELGPPRLLAELAPDLLALLEAPVFAESEPPRLPPPTRELTAPVVERTASLAASECVIELVSPLSADPTELAADEPDGTLLGAAGFDGAALDGAWLDDAGLDDRVDAPVVAAAVLDVAGAWLAS